MSSANTQISLCIADDEQAVFVWRNTIFNTLFCLMSTATTYRKYVSMKLGFIDTLSFSLLTTES